MESTTSAPREPRIHGNAMFPIGVYFVTLTPGPRQELVAHHWHDEAEFVLVKTGCVDVQIGTQIYRVGRGQGVFIPGGQVHSLSAPDANPSECHAVVFDIEMLSSSLYDTVQHQFIHPLLEHTLQLPTRYTGYNDWGTRALACMRDVIHLFEYKPQGYELGIKGSLFLFLSTLAAQNQITQDRDVTSLDEQNLLRLKTILTSIKDRSSEKIRLSDLAALVNMSEGHFCRFFKQMTNKRPMEYLNDYRVNQAAELLHQTHRSVMDIAFDVGFDNVSYFIKVFRTVKHCTPSQYRHLVTAEPAAASEV